MINKGREFLVYSLNIGSVALAGITTTNSTNVRIIGGDDDAIYTLDTNTVHESFSTTGGTVVKGTKKFAVGTGTSIMRPDGTLLSDGAQSATTAVVTEETLKTYTLPLDTLISIGHGLKVTVFGSFANTATVKTLRLKFNGTVISTNNVTTSPQDDVFKIEATISYHGGGNSWCFGSGVVGAVNQTNTFTAFATDVATDLDIVVTGQNGTANASDIVVRQFTVSTINEY